MNHRLYIVEGLPCSGKSTISAFVASILGRNEKTCFIDEGTGNHPADYEFHALLPSASPDATAQIVPLSLFSGEELEKLLPYKIYDGLPWDKEKPIMLDKWRQFVQDAQADTVYVFNCVLLQNPMCETMMRFDFPESASQQHIEEIAAIIAPMNPLVVYLKNDNIAASVQSAVGERPGWLDAVIDYHVNGGYGKRIGAQGFEGYIACLRERQERELRILSHLPVERIILDNPQRDWARASAQLEALLRKESESA